MQCMAQHPPPSARRRAPHGARGRKRAAMPGLFLGFCSASAGHRAPSRRGCAVHSRRWATRRLAVCGRLACAAQSRPHPRRGEIWAACFPVLRRGAPAALPRSLAPAGCATHATAQVTLMTHRCAPSPAQQGSRQASRGRSTAAKAPASARSRGGSGGARALLLRGSSCAGPHSSRARGRVVGVLGGGAGSASNKTLPDRIILCECQTRCARAASAAWPGGSGDGRRGL